MRKEKKRLGPQSNWPTETGIAHHQELRALIRHLARISATQDYRAFLKGLRCDYIENNKDGSQ